MTAEEMAQDPAVRAAVFATVTREEADRVMHTPPGRPWCDAALLLVVDGLAGNLDPDLGAEMRAGVRTVID